MQEKLKILENQYTPKYVQPLILKYLDCVIIMPSAKPPTYVAVFMLLMILFGSMNTLNDKFQNQQYVQEGGISKYFYHPYMQTAVTYIAVASAFPIFHILNRVKKKKEQITEGDPNGQRARFNPFLVLINSFCDTLATLMQGIALNFVPASSYQMMRGGSIATTFLFSIFYLKTKPQKHHFVGIGLAILGVLLVGSNSLIYSTSSSKNEDPGLEVTGYILLLISLFLNGFSLVYQEHLFRKYSVEPLRLVGFEGLFGIIFNAIILAIVTFVPCSFGIDACVYDSGGSAFLQRPEMYFHELGQNKLLLIFCIFELISILGFNICAISVTNYSSAVARSVCDVTRTIIIWTVGIAITLTIGAEQENYRWEYTQIGAIVIQVSGFVLIVLGNLIFNQIFGSKLKESEQTSNSSLLEKSEN